MNRLSNILLVATLSFTTLCSCNKYTELENENNTTVDIPIPAEGYIFFNGSIPKTRGGAKQSGPLNADFNVLGYRYPSSWEAIKPQAKQTLRITYTNNDGTLVSEQETVADNHVGVFGINHNSSNPGYATATPGTQLVEYKNSNYEYAPLQSWQKGLSYAFFAWYPTNLEANGGETDYEGSPYISYTLPSGVDKAARQSMVDILTACEIDYTKRDGMTVSLEMNHRLAALDIRASSLITAEALIDNKYSEFEGINENSPVTIDVNSLTLTLDGIKTEAIIPLNDKDADEKIEATGSANKDYTGFTLATDIGGGELKSLVGDDELLILIPQTEPIDVEVNISYTIKCEGKKKDFTFNTANADTDITISNLESGVYHYIELTFTKTGLFVQANQAVTWKDKVDVDHKFE